MDYLAVSMLTAMAATVGNTHKVKHMFRDMACKFLEKLGFKPKEPKQSHGIRR